MLTSLLRHSRLINRINDTIPMVRGGIMKNLIFSIALMLLFMGIAGAETYAEGFDMGHYWDSVLMGAKHFASPEDPVNDRFSSDMALRETNPTNSGLHAWKIEQGDHYFRYECSEIISRFSVYLARWAENQALSFAVKYSTDSGVNYTVIESLNKDWFTADQAYKQYSHTFPTPIKPSPGNKIYIEIHKTAGQWLFVDDFAIEYEYVPVITVSQTALSGFTYMYGVGPSAEQSFTVSGAYLTDDINIFPPAHYEISTTSGGEFVAGNPITLSRSVATVSSTHIYIRLKADLTIDVYNEDVTASSLGAVNKPIACSGSVTPILYTEIYDGNPVNQNFDSLTAAGSWENGTTLTGWYARTDATEFITTYGLNPGAPLIAGLYSFGSAGNPDRALGFAPGGDFTGADGAGKGYLGWRLKNGSGYTVNALKITWTGEQWFKSKITAFHRLNLSYQSGTAVSDLASGSWISTASSFISPKTGKTAATGLDGNAAENRIADIEVTITGLNLADGDEIMLRWDDLNDTGADHLMAIDDISVQLIHYPQDLEVDVQGLRIKISGGDGIMLAQPLTPVPNPDFAIGFEQAIRLAGSGPWDLRIYTTDTWVACLENGAWRVAEVPAEGYASFSIEHPGTGDKIIELKSGNGSSPTLPVELSTFTVSLSGCNSAMLTWVTQTETNVNGFHIYRNTEDFLASATLISNLILATNTSQQKVYVFKDKELSIPGTYYYWLEVSDLDGSDSYYGPIYLLYEGGNNQQSPDIPKITELESPYPNPFHPSTTLRYGLAKTDPVKITIYNGRGQMVRSIDEGKKSAGHYNLAWNGDDDRGRSLPTGVYCIRMQAGSKSFIKKAVLLK